MMKITSSLVALFLVFATGSLHAKSHEGTQIELEAVPSYVERIFVPTLPGATNSLDVLDLKFDAVVEAPRGFHVRIANGGVRIDAPQGEAGGYARVRSGKRELTLTLVNMIPYTEMRAGRLDGYRVGEYAPPHKGLETYAKPLGFIRLSPQNADMWVADHYRMRDFQCKLDGDTKFLVLRTEALLKLEILQHELETKHGFDFNRFTIMSGYRTPYYNSRIGNDTSSSRHLYGDAMDIYIDDDGDGSMDDVNRDGQIDTGDARFLLRVAETIDNSREWGWLKGGAGVYHANAAHGPYIHVDARGYVARWGAIEERASARRSSR